MTEFKDNIYQVDGTHDILIYKQGLIDGHSFTDEAACGKADTNPLSPNTTSTSIVNGDLHTMVGETTFQNFVRHEFMHNMMGAHADDNAPDPTAKDPDHSYGANKGLLDELTPMITGYAETRRGGNQKPDECCSGSTKTANAHTGSLSDCTHDEINWYVNNTF